MLTIKKRGPLALGARPGFCGADFQVCCVAGFPTRLRDADSEIGGTAGFGNLRYHRPLADSARYFQKMRRALALALVVAAALCLTACGPPGPRALHKGDRLVESGNFDEAVGVLSQAVNQLSNDPPARAQATPTPITSRRGRS